MSNTTFLQNRQGGIADPLLIPLEFEGWVANVPSTGHMVVVDQDPFNGDGGDDMSHCYIKTFGYDADPAPLGQYDMFNEEIYSPEERMRGLQMRPNSNQLYLMGYSEDMEAPNAFTRTILPDGSIDYGTDDAGYLQAANSTVGSYTGTNSFRWLDDFHLILAEPGGRVFVGGLTLDTGESPPIYRMDDNISIKIPYPSGNTWATYTVTGNGPDHLVACNYTADPGTPPYADIVGFHATVEGVDNGILLHEYKPAGGVARIHSRLATSPDKTKFAATSGALNSGSGEWEGHVWLHTYGNPTATHHILLPEVKINVELFVDLIYAEGRIVVIYAGPPRTNPATGLEAAYVGITVLNETLGRVVNYEFYLPGPISVPISAALDNDGFVWVRTGYGPNSKGVENPPTLFKTGVKL